MSEMEMTIKQLLDISAEAEGLVKVIGRNSTGTPIYAVIAIRGTPETSEIVEAVEVIEKQWRNDEGVSSEC